MRILVTLAVLVLAGHAGAEPSKDPDLTFQWKEGEMSKDMSIWTTTITVTGTKLHYSQTYAGRNRRTKPVEVDGVVKDRKRLDAAIAAFDKLKPKPVAKQDEVDSGKYNSGCLTRGKTQRCASRFLVEPESDELKALAAIKAALLDGVKL